MKVVPKPSKAVAVAPRRLLPTSASPVVTAARAENVTKVVPAESLVAMATRLAVDSDKLALCAKFKDFTLNQNLASSRTYYIKL